MLNSTEPKEAPTDVKAQSISASQIRVTWKPPNPGPGRPRGYEVLLRSFFLVLFLHGLMSIKIQCVAFCISTYFLTKSPNFLSKGQLLERRRAGGVGEETKDFEKRNLHHPDSTRRQQPLRHHCKRLQQHRPEPGKFLCYSQD